MNRRPNARFFQPRLETLEARNQPSFLLGGTNAINQLATPLNNMVGDMGKVQNDLTSQVQILLIPGTAGTPQNVNAFGKATADYQRLLIEQAAIQGTSNADVAFINAVALNEAVAGDPTDFIILKFGSIFHLDPTASLTGQVTSANNIVNLATNSLSTVDQGLTLFGITTIPGETTGTPTSF